ncbi:MAG: zinc-ribbon domain-containing protein [Myxococcota bacterium]|nr:zinc-ribbon domain-containing protein [Myxococcota bacterium]
MISSAGSIEGAAEATVDRLRGGHCGNSGHLFDMDVFCKNCGTEYEFDAARIGPQGVKVKCTACDAVFLVQANSQTPITVSTTDWLVRTSDDRLISFEKLTTLQKWIIEGRIERQDEISRDGESWKRMGNVPALEPFFSVFDRASALNDLMNTGSIGEHPVLINGSEVLATANPIRRTRPASHITKPPSIPTVPAKPRRTSQALIDTQPVTVQDRIARRASDISVKSTIPYEGEEASVSDRPSFEPDVPTEAIAQNEIQNAAPPSYFDSEIETGFSGPSDFGQLDLDNEVRDDESIRAYEKKSRIKRRILGIASLMVGGLMGGAVFALYGVPQSPISKIKNSAVITSSDKKTQALVEAQQKFEQDSLETLRFAEQTYGKAIKADPTNIDLLPLRALVMTTWAGQLRRIARLQERRTKDFIDAKNKFEKQVDLYESLPPQAKKRATQPIAPKALEVKRLKSEVESFRKQASTLTKQAFKLIQRSNENGASKLGTLRALADYYRVQRDPKTFDYINKAKALISQGGQKDPVILFIEAAALSASADKQNRASRAKVGRQLEEVLTLRPTLVRARILLARLQIEQDAISLAEAQLKQVLKESPGHTEARIILLELKSSTKTQRSTTISEAPQLKKSEKSLEVRKKTKEVATKTAKQASISPYQRFLNQGRKLRKENLPWKALLAYEKATELRKSSAAPYIGIGWCYLELGKPIAALNQFKKASLVAPDSAEAYLGQGRALTAQGKLKLAIEKLERTIEMSPRSRHAKSARKTIAEIEDSE